MEKMRSFVVCWAVFRLSFADVPLLLSEVTIPAEDGCVDNRGGRVGDGDRYTPRGKDPCEQCTCQKGRPDSCSITSCYPPAQCDAPYLRRSGQCCDYACNGTSAGNPNGNDTLSATNLGLRLVASTVTSFLILALLLFMIHRLRKRRLLVMIRRVDGCRRELDEACIAHHFALEDAAAMGYFVGRDRICDEPPPPYTFWKPPETYVPPGEAPPPYEVSVLPPCGDQVPSVPVLMPSCDQVSRITQTTPCGREEGEVSSSSSSDEGGDEVIRSDAYYEDGLSTLSRGNVTVVHVGGTLPTPSSGEQRTPTGTSENVRDDLPEYSERSSTGNNRPPVHIPQTLRRNAQRSGCSDERCVSCCESAPRTLVQDDAKRLSLQVPSVKCSRYPDPTEWNGGEGGSESSSSSASPDHSHGAFSPTSSESSYCSGDVNFVKQSPPNGAQCTSSVPSKTKGSLDRTLQRLRRFSLPRKKAAKSQTDLKGQERSGGTLAVAASVTLTEAVNSVAVATSGTEDKQCCQHSSPVRISNRPASLSLQTTTTSKAVSSATPVIITVHCQPAGTVSTVGDTNAVENARLSRSGSICSETGERRHRESSKTGITRGSACSVSVQPHCGTAAACTIPRQSVARQVAKLEAVGFKPQGATDVNVRRQKSAASNVCGRRTRGGHLRSEGGASAL